jgi:putative transposase
LRQYGQNTLKSPFSIQGQSSIQSDEKETTIAQLSSEYGLHPNLIHQWKRRMMQELPEKFSNKKSKPKQETQELASEL